MNPCLNLMNFVQLMWCLVLCIDIRNYLHVRLALKVQDVQPCYCVQRCCNQVGRWAFTFFSCHLKVLVCLLFETFEDSLIHSMIRKAGLICPLAWCPIFRAISTKRNKRLQIGRYDKFNLYWSCCDVSAVVESSVGISFAQVVHVIAMLCSSRTLAPAAVSCLINQGVLIANLSNWQWYACGASSLDEPSMNKCDLSINLFVPTVPGNNKFYAVILSVFA